MDYNWGGRFCGDCGKKWEDGCGHMGVNPPPKFAVGDLVYRHNGDEPASPVLDRALILDHKPECGDSYDGHSASCIETLRWYYEVNWHSHSRYVEKDLHTRTEALNYRTWYWWWGGGGKPVFEQVKRSILDATCEEVSALIERFEAAKAAKIRALTTERELGIQIDLRGEGFP